MKHPKSPTSILNSGRFASVFAAAVVLALVVSACAVFSRGETEPVPDGTGEVVDNSLLAGTVTVKMDDGTVVTLNCDEVTVVSRTKSRAKVRTQKRRRREDEEMMSDKDYEQDLLRRIADLEEEDE